VDAFGPMKQSLVEDMSPSDAVAALSSMSEDEKARALVATSLEKRLAIEAHTAAMKKSSHAAKCSVKIIVREGFVLGKGNGLQVSLRCNHFISRDYCMHTRSPHFLQII